MLQSWKEILPGDHYAVRSVGILHFYDQKIITSLYQPLVGIEATSLYFTLWQELDASVQGILSTHHHLMSVMNLSLDRILKARKKLEAVGLIQTLKKKQSDPGLFLYRLFPPMTPARFFHDDLLSVFLYHQIGSRDFKKLAQLFEVKTIRMDEFQDLSAAFDDVFESLPSGEVSEEKAATPDGTSWEGRAESGQIHLRKPFNFQELRGYLSDAILTEDALTDEVKAAVEKLAFVYQTTPFDMSRAIESASLHTGIVDIEMLRKEVRDFYKLEHGPEEMPALYDRTQPSSHSEMKGKEPRNEEEQLIAWYETNSPYQLLEQLGYGSRPAAPDLRLVENLMFDTKLPPGVINVLIDYVAKVNDNNLNKSFVEKIAAQWSRANVRTVREAMFVAREEKRKRDDQKQSPVKKTNRPRRTAERVHHEVVPEWMKGKSHETKDKVSEEEARKRAKWLEDYLNSI
ncbi:replication initiation and membrane attachment family protein [Sporolactobacillus sp. THM19-2]|uniref:replication initiation and membrane attachment family protein n=1 Tax=Sporolactobacillus sp. THM19-2 TaxID=2511171 RepID=UPI00101FF153|nr:DnaD domain protein [Sporolactobacillus sp. THM19-2]RYL94620.1 replication initiation and membrane attachment family protein [Sporolactobacillus sp. THM19-2]